MLPFEAPEFELPKPHRELPVEFLSRDIRDRSSFRATFKNPRSSWKGGQQATLQCRRHRHAPDRQSPAQLRSSTESLNAETSVRVQRQGPAAGVSDPADENHEIQKHRGLRTLAG